MIDLDVAAIRARADVAQPYVPSMAMTARHMVGESAADVPALLDALSVAEAARDEATAALERVKALTREGRDGVRWVHNPGCKGEPTCPACWSIDIHSAVRGDQS